MLSNDDISVRYKFFGHRLLSLKKTDAFGEEWVDVPEHFGRFYPSTLELPAKRLHGSPEGRWFTKQLGDILAEMPVAYRVKFVRPVRPAKEAIFINCLDPVFGHALYKLAAAQAVARHAVDSDVIVIVTENLRHYAGFAAGQILVQEPLSRLLVPSTNLMSAVMSYAADYHQSRWAFCNGSRVGDQQLLPQPQVQEASETPDLVTFVHRDDRAWGGTIGIQALRVNKVFRGMKKINPRVKTAVIGLSKKGAPYSADLNFVTSDSDEAYELRLISLAKRSLCVFGTHGSHMLIPSYHANSTLELQPSCRLGNAVQAYWPNPGKTVIEALYTYRVLYGNRFLLDVTAGAALRHIESLVSGTPALLARLDSEVHYDSWSSPRVGPA